MSLSDHNEEIDLSRTEDLLDALADALAAREEVQRIRVKYGKHNLEAFGEIPLEQALQAPMEVYNKKLETLRARLTLSGLQV